MAITSTPSSSEDFSKIGTPFEHHLGFDYPGSDNSMNAIFADLRINAVRDALNEVASIQAEPTEVIEPEVDTQVVKKSDEVPGGTSKPSPLLITPAQSILRDRMTEILIRQEVMGRR